MSGTPSASDSEIELRFHVSTINTRIKRRKRISLESAVCQEPPDGGVLQDRPLLNPEITDKTFSARVHSFDEFFGQGGHFPTKRENEGEGFGEVEECIHERIN
jgi:hypothetical protein